MSEKNKSLSDAIIKFRNQYPNVTSGDIQTFILGYNAAIQSNKRKNGDVQYLIKEQEYWLLKKTSQEQDYYYVRSKTKGLDSIYWGIGYLNNSGSVSFVGGPIYGELEKILESEFLQSQFVEKETYVENEIVNNRQLALDLCMEYGFNLTGAQFKTLLKEYNNFEMTLTERIKLIAEKKEPMFIEFLKTKNLS